MCDNKIKWKDEVHKWATEKYFFCQLDKPGNQNKKINKK